MNHPEILRRRKEKEWEHDLLLRLNRAHIRANYLLHSPISVRHYTDSTLLRALRLKYCPATEPRSIEEFIYFQLLVEAIDDRLRQL